MREIFICKFTPQMAAELDQPKTRSQEFHLSLVWGHRNSSAQAIISYHVYQQELQLRVEDLIPGNIPSNAQPPAPQHPPKILLSSLLKQNTISLFGRQNDREKREREREADKGMNRQVLLCPDGSKRKGWTCPKPRAQSSIQVMFLCFARLISRKLGRKQNN